MMFSNPCSPMGERLRLVWQIFPFCRKIFLCLASKKQGEIGMAKNKHLTDEERILIENWLKARISLKEIARNLEKSTSTVSREIRKHSLDTDKYAPYLPHNRCVKRARCDVRYLCENLDCTRKCSACNRCNKICDAYEEQICYKLFEPPYVCNGCNDERLCVLRKKYYFHKKAHEAYREMLVESRVGANISEGELLYLDEFVSPLFMRGHSVHHISTNNSDKLTVSEKTLYRYVDGGLLKAKNIDMPRVCRLKPRKTKPVEHKVDSGCRIGRTYAEYTQFIEQSGVSAVEMDSVIGRVGGKVLLTLMFKSCDFMFAFLRERNTSQSVIDVFNDLYARLNADCFKSLFPVLLGDNGSEFSNPKAIEHDADGVQRTRIFYCDPYASYQKPNVELNHEFIRRILQKGRSFDDLTQADINLMMSHINSYTREKLNDKSPLEMFGFLYGKDILEKLGLSQIPPNEIFLKPALLKK
jgi:IS30 family transposase